jgi:hypothetical protein
VRQRTLVGIPTQKFTRIDPQGFPVFWRERDSLKYRT